MGKYRIPKGDVAWFAPKLKRPIAYSTKATEDIILLLAEKGYTIQQVYDNIFYDDEAEVVMKAYIDRGYGDVIAKEWFGKRG